MKNNINSLFEQAYNLLQEARYDDAEYYLKKIINLDGNHPDSLYLMGIIKIKTGNVDESLIYLNKAISVNPLKADYCNDIALVYEQADMVDKALEFFKKAINLEPENHLFLFNIGNLYLHTGNLKQAVEYYKKAITINHVFADAYNNLGQALHKLQDVDSAENAYREAIKINNNFASTHNNLGTLLQDKGDFEGAMASYYEALRCDPNFVLAASNIAYLKKCESREDEIIQLLNRLIEQDDLGIEDEISILFALGKLYDECHEYNEAFKNYERGNLLAGRDSKFERTSYEVICDAIIKSFTPEFFKALEYNGSDSDKPVFIVGMPRSGTSLVEQIISTHTSVTGAGELDYFNELSGINKNDQDLFKLRLKFFLNAGKIDLVQIANAYLDELVRYSANNYKYVVDKMPYNFFNLGLISIIFPNAHVIYCKRDPYDNCLSIYFQYFQGFHNYSFDLENIAFFYKLHEDLLSHWRHTIGKPLLTVQYEDLINNPEISCKKIIDFLGLTWEQECLDFYKSNRPVFTRSNVQVRQPLYQSSVNRWKNYKHFIEPVRRVIN